MPSLLPLPSGFRHSSGFDINYNTGISTLTSGRNRLTAEETRLVTGHEIGHNWGSYHDPGGDPNCRNQFLMNAFAQDGSNDNHRRFSICSRRSIGLVLLSKVGSDIHIFLVYVWNFELKFEIG